jgi:predicted outer membrane protein
MLTLGPGLSHPGSCPAVALTRIECSERAATNGRDPRARSGNCQPRQRLGGIDVEAKQQGDPLMRSLIVAGLVVALESVAVPCQAELNSFDREFLTKAVRSNMTAVQEAQWANESDQSQPMKALAQRIIRDHSDALAELKKIAQAQNVSLPSLPTTHQQSVRDNLKGQSGDQLRQDYLHRTVDQRKQDIALCEQQLHEGAEADLHQYCQRNLPNLQEEVTMAQSAETHS